MGYTNLPGITESVQDGNLTFVPVNTNPIVAILGTSAQGASETLYRVDRVSDAARIYGKDGTLVRGLYETAVAGALNTRLFRIGATPAKLVTNFGLTIETIEKDDSAGTDYLLFWDVSELRLRVYRAIDDTLVYDNYPAYPDSRVDLGEVSVTGTAVVGTSTDYGAVPGAGEKTLADLAVTSGLTFTAGTDGLSMSRMETYEALYKAYKLLEDQQIDVVVPMNVYIDDLNVMDMSAATVSGLALTALSDYPSASASNDVLGRVHIEEYQGEYYFWWWFPANPASPTFARAQIYPAGVGSASASKSIANVTLTAADFTEVNFAHQLATFCYKKSRDDMDLTGNMGVLPPASFSLKDVSKWVGTLPTVSVDGNGVATITANGTGLLGNKFMSGRLTSGGVPGHVVNGVDGLFNGGLIATDDDSVDGTQLKDNNDHLIDIGKYINVVAAYPVLANSSKTTSYTASAAATYAGFYSVLPVASAPTNKLLSSLRLPFRINPAKLDLLAGQRYVTFHQKPRGIVVSDAPTAARPDSDYTRLSTVRQVKASMDAIRNAAEPFLGEGMTGAMTAALDTAIDRALSTLVKTNVISRYEFQTTITPQMRVLGQATVELKLIPAFELRQITVVVALAAV